MLFNSFSFLIFFPVVTLLYFFLPHRFRWSWLLAASCFFYMFFKPIYILILFFTIIIDYFAGILLEDEKNEKRKKWWLIMSLVANIGVLAVFKYYNFINENITGLCRLLGHTNHIPYLSILLPIGLSFHTFQAMSYTLEVYRGNHKAERHLGIYALYVMFYPQLVAGPIERPQNILYQFYEKHYFDYQRVVEGLRLIGWGLFKKVVIADRLAIFVNTVYDHPDKYHGFQTILACVFFAFQIFADFSGYSDIACGAARVMGFELMKNFERPFLSKNVTEFWRRWHISLSTWFNDYLFQPFVVTYRDWNKKAVVIGLMLTFTLSGLWHGANWTFVVFGVLHGVALVYEFLTKKIRSRTSKKVAPVIYNSVSRFITFWFLVLTWIFFRAPTIQNAFVVIKNCFKLSKAQLGLYMINPDAYNFILCFVLIAFMELIYHLAGKNDINEIMNKQTKIVRWAIYLLFMFLITNLGIFGNNSFIYFQF